MWLILFLGVIVNLTLVCGDGDVGTRGVKDFDWSKFSGPRPWYWRLHTPNPFDNDFDCPVSNYAPPEGNISLITGDSYYISKQRHVAFSGKATNWKPTGYWEEFYQEPTLTSVRVYAIAVDYDRYVILKIYSFDSDQPAFYVLFRSQHPDKATVKDVLKELKKNHIDVCQLAEYSRYHCQ